MRLVRGGAPGASLSDHWRFMRDCGQRAASPSEVAAFADIHAPMPPSRAHIKRLQRNRPVVTAPEPRPVVADCARVRFMREQMAATSREIVKLSQSAPQPAMTWDASRGAFDRTADVRERGTAVPLTFEQLCQRADALVREFHRLARFMPYPCHGAAYDDWCRRRATALRAARQAELDCAYA